MSDPANPVPLVAMPLFVSADTQLAIERYTRARVEHERAGMNKRQLQEARSYAVEAIHGLLRDNPAAFNYSRLMETIRKEKLEASGGAR